MQYNGSDKHKIALFENKQDKLVAGPNIELTPQSDGTVKISAEGGSSSNVDDVKVNGTSVVDENKVAQVTSYKEITQAQYDALPASKLTDNILYCIKDTGIVEGEQFAPVIYSLSEREIGVWTDGKPLYQCTVSINSLPSGAELHQYQHGIADIDTVCCSYGFIRWSSGNIMPLNTLQFNSLLQLNPDASFFYIAGKTYIQIQVGMDRSSASADITIQYTKTTDVPGSGTWGTDGVPMVHYDGNEKIVGTWFGETLYAKTVHINSLPSSTSTSGVNYPHGIANINTICTYDAIARWPDGNTTHLNHSVFWSGSENSSILITVSKTNITIVVGIDRSSMSADVTIYYTKTS